MKNLFGILLFVLFSLKSILPQWQQTQQFTYLDLESTCYPGEQNTFVVGEYGSIFHSSDNGNTWSSIYLPNTDILNAIYFMEESVGYIVGDNGKIIQKDYNDSTWQDISIPDYFHLKDVTFNDYENGIVVGTKQVRIDGRTYYLPTIHITTNAGTSWIEKTFDIRGKLNSVSYFGEENIITVGDSGMVLLSNDLGNNWSYLNLNVNSNLYEVKYCPDGIGIIVGDSGTIIISDDGWQTWECIAVPEYWHIKSVCSNDVYQFVAAGHMQVRIDGRDFNVATIFHSSDGGINWDKMFISEEGSFNSVSFCNPDLAIAVGDNGLFSLYNSPVSIDDIAKNLITNFSLYQNYPNPFNPSTKIRYSVPEQSKVVIRVYDILGKEVAILMDEEKQTGTYELTWNAINLPSGVFFYQLKAGNYIDTKKMLLLK